MLYSPRLFLKFVKMHIMESVVILRRFRMCILPYPIFDFRIRQRPDIEVAYSIVP